MTNCVNTEYHNNCLGCAIAEAKAEAKAEKITEIAMKYGLTVSEVSDIYQDLTEAL